jgi:hypothetical protein
VPLPRVLSFPRLLLSSLLCLALGAGSPLRAEVLHGFTNFPHDLTPDAAEVVHGLTVPNSTLYAQHMDQCLPWHEALSGAPFPDWLQADLAEIRRFRSPHQTMYVAVTPTMNDRQTLAEACGADEGSPRPLPDALQGRPLDDPAVMKAYLAYVRRIFDALDPAYANIGIEMSELALRAPQEWPAFARLFRATVDGLHDSHPQVHLGMELVLQSLLDPAVADLVKADAEYGDYIGISFYPYGGGFGELFGAPALPPPPDEWRAPLAFLRGWTDRPVAMAETGYASAPVRVEEAGGVDFGGDPDLQTLFLIDIMAEAKAQDWAFLVWFVAADYTRLYDKLAASGAGAEWMKIWMHTGLWDADLAPKPALAVWNRWGVEPGGEPRLPEGAGCLSPGSRLAPATGPDGGAAVEWTVTYAGDWELCHLPLRAPAGPTGLTLQVKSAPTDMILLQIEETDGDRFYWLHQAPADWARLALTWAEATLAPGSTGDGRLDPAGVRQVTLGDGAGAEGTTGQRRIWATLPQPLP